MKPRLKAALLVALCALALGAASLRSSLPALTVQGFAGIVNPADVCNGWHPDVCPVAFDDRVFQDRIAWVSEEVGAEGASFYAIPLPCPPGNGPCIPFSPTMVVFKRGEMTLETSVREIIQGVEAVRIAGLQRFGAKQSDIFLRWYPGYEARHPSNGNPVGEPWPDHPYARNGWKMFRPSAKDNDRDFPVGSVFQLDQRKWRKWRAQIKPGAGPFGAGGVVADAWEEVTLR